MSAPPTEIWYGQAGHFICADRCSWHLHTHVQGASGQWYCISSVGELRYDRGGPLESLRGLGPNESPITYETMVFTAPAEDVNFSVENKCDVALYRDRDDARNGHMAAIAKWRTK